jgi:hypothetical protein
VEWGDCDIETRVEWADRLGQPLGTKVFDSGALWALYEEGPDFVFDFVTQVLGRQPYKRLRINQDFSEGRLCLNRGCLPDAGQIFPLEYPVDELLVTNWLARAGGGVELHGCGLVDSETGGHLFLGHSGAGKSTTTRLWRSLRHARVLSDDRIILRRHGDDIWMHGTPWHGEAGFASPEATAIRHIFVLEHGAKNTFTQLSQSQAIAEIFARSFVPFHNRRALDSTLSYLQDITAEVPCYRFEFLPDSHAVDAITSFYG